MRFILKYLKPYRLSIILSLCVRFISAIMDLVLPMILAFLIDSIVPKGNLYEILLWGLLMIFCSISAFVSAIYSNRTAVKVSRDATEKMRFDLFARCMNLSQQQIDAIGIPSLESRLSSDTYQIHNMINQIQRIGVRAPILFIGGIFITLLMDSTLTLIFIAAVPFIALSSFLISRRSIPLHFSARRAEDEMVRVVRENAQGVRIIKALSKQDYEKRRFDKANQQLTDRESAAGITMAANSPIINLILNLGLCCIILLGARQVQIGQTQTGKIIAFLNYFTIISNATLMITKVFLTYTKGIASSHRIAEIVQMPEDSCKRCLECKTENENHYLSFHHVSFSYEGSANTLSDISFSMEKGETLGIIGATGSGKTTLISLLMRFWDIDQGQILINGTDIRAIPAEQLLRKFGIVMQNDFIFAGTIEENINFFRNLSMEQIVRAAEIAQAAPFIENLSDRYEHLLTSKGTNISGGQRQRILIARAIAAMPEILILDDSSSALDYKTDAALRTALQNAMGSEITQIIIAQRISSVMNADRIIVLDRGRIAAIGTHSELLSCSEIYREISNSQLGGSVN